MLVAMSSAIEGQEPPDQKPEHLRESGLAPVRDESQPDSSSYSLVAGRETCTYLVLDPDGVEVDGAEHCRDADVA